MLPVWENSVTTSGLGILYGILQLKNYFLGVMRSFKDY